VRRIALISCGKTKRPEASPAADLYTSPLFRMSLRHAVQTCDDLFILSAKHGLVEPQAVLAPYNFTMADMTAAQRVAWGRAVAKRLGPLGNNTLVIYAGESYIEPIRRAAPTWKIEAPLAGLGLFERLSWLKRRLR
jgi:hypothetical protein